MIIIQVTAFSIRLRFKEEVGITPHAYINEYRIKMAQEILVRDPSSIAAVAVAVGFEDASYFAEQFKKLTNYYPSEYRKLFNKRIQREFKFPDNRK